MLPAVLYDLTPDWMLLLSLTAGGSLSDRGGEVISFPNEYVAAHHSSKLMAQFSDMMISFYGLPSTVFLFAACSATILSKFSIEYPFCLVNPANSCCFIPESISGVRYGREDNSKRAKQGDCIRCCPRNPGKCRMVELLQPPAGIKRDCGIGIPAKFAGKPLHSRRKEDRSNRRYYRRSIMITSCWIQMEAEEGKTAESNRNLSRRRPESDN